MGCVLCVCQLNLDSTRPWKLPLGIPRLDRVRFLWRWWYHLVVTVRPSRGILAFDELCVISARTPGGGSAHNVHLLDFTSPLLARSFVSRFLASAPLLDLARRTGTVSDQSPRTRVGSARGFPR